MGIANNTILPNLKGHVVIVTGGNSGLGYETAFQLALHQARVYIAARSNSRIEDAIAQMKNSTSKDLDLKSLTIDLTSLRSVDLAAKAFMQTESRLDILINNAGVMACPFAVTEDGFETQWQINHLAPFLFVRALLPILESTAASLSTVRSPNSRFHDGVRIVNVSSSAALEMAPKAGLDLANPNLPSESGALAPMRRYGHSKLASMLHARALHDKLSNKGISAYSLHPGIVLTNLQSKNPTVLGSVLKFAVKWGIIPGTVSVKEGVRTTLWCATSEEARSGKYYVPPGKVDEKAEKSCGDEKLVQRLWVESERMLENAGY